MGAELKNTTINSGGPSIWQLGLLHRLLKTYLETRHKPYLLILLLAAPSWAAAISKLPNEFFCGILKINKIKLMVFLSIKGGLVLEGGQNWYILS